MDSETTTTAPETTIHYLPHDLVFKILLLLDAKPLMRFACVCKAWHHTITGDRYFQREHHRLQELCVLIAPRIRSSSDFHAPLLTTMPGLYRWERKMQQSALAATLLQAQDGSVAAVEEAKRHTLAHCNGLVLLPTDGGWVVRVINPATRRVLTLPPSPHGAAPQPSVSFHRALGLGHDPRTDTYKVVRFFYRSIVVPRTGYIRGLEVFTIGRDQHWRETAVPPPYPVMKGRTATFFKGSLLWAIDESVRVEKPVRGFLRFNLEDESFGIMPAPPGCPDLKDHASNLVENLEIRGELCLAHERQTENGEYLSRQWNVSGSVSIWASSNTDPPRWVRRHVIDDVPLPIRMIAGFDDGGILFQGQPDTLEFFDSQTTQVVSRVITSMHRLRYHHPDMRKLVKYTHKTVHDYDVIPYVPSLVPI